MRTWLALILTLTLGALGLPAAAEELATRDGRPVRTVAVISGLGDEITLYYAHPSVPVTVWEGDTRSFVIPDFAIDARIERTIAATIAPRFNVVSLDPKFAGTGQPILDERTVRGIIANLPPRPDIDAYIVVCHEETSIEMGAFLTTHGLVLYRRWKLFGDLTGLLGFYRLLVVDARTGETIVGRTGGIETDIFHPSTARKEIDDAFWPGEDKLPSPDQVPALRDEFYKFVDESILWTLRRMKLTP